MAKRLAELELGAVGFAEDGACGPAKRRSVQDSPTSSASSSSDDTDYSPCAGGGASSGGAPTRMGGAPQFPLASLVHAAAAERGARPYMEDAHATLELEGSPRGARAYAVFDGHGGAHAAEFCAARLLPRLREEARRTAGTAAAAPGGTPGPSYPASLRAAFAGIDADLAATRRAHLCGTTAAVCVVTQEWLFAGNAGELALPTQGAALPRGARAGRGRRRAAAACRRGRRARARGLGP
jgi:hypothetical protein